jgi:hypothetical protein
MTGILMGEEQVDSATLDSIRDPAYRPGVNRSINTLRMVKRIADDDGSGSEGVSEQDPRALNINWVTQPLDEDPDYIPRGSRVHRQPEAIERTKTINRENEAVVDQMKKEDPGYQRAVEEESRFKQLVEDHLPINLGPRKRTFEERLRALTGVDHEEILGWYMQYKHWQYVKGTRSSVLNRKAKMDSKKGFLSAPAKDIPTWQEAKEARDAIDGPSKLITVGVKGKCLPPKDELETDLAPAGLKGDVLPGVISDALQQERHRLEEEEDQEPDVELEGDEEPADDLDLAATQRGFMQSVMSCRSRRSC